MPSSSTSCRLETSTSCSSTLIREDDGRPQLGGQRPDLGDLVLVGRGQRHQRDGAALQQVGGDHAGLGGTGVGVVEVAGLAQPVDLQLGLGEQLGVAGPAVARGPLALQRPGAEHDADRERQEDSHQGGDVGAEGDHVTSPRIAS